MSETVPKITPICLSNSHTPNLGTSLHAYVWSNGDDHIIAKSSIYMELDEARLMAGADQLHPPQVRAARAVTFVYRDGERIQMISDFAQESDEGSMFGFGAFYRPKDGVNVHGDVYALKPLDEVLLRLSMDIASVLMTRVHDDIPIEDGPTAPWCVNHQVTKENLAGTDCIALMGEGRVFKCPYKNLAAAKCAEFPCPEAEAKA